MATENDQKIVAAAIKRFRSLKLKECFNPDDLESRPNPKQLAVLQDVETKQRFIVAGNRSGKTQLGAREVTWWFDETHPYMARPKEWGEGPLLILVIGRVGKQIQDEIWANKIKPFLTPGTYKEKWQGGELQKVTHTKNGNRILFLSHHNANEAREKAQAFTAHYVWIDEMPSSVSLMTELMVRTLTGGGRFLATFTPLIRNEEIRLMVEGSVAPIAKKYQFSMLDNPLFKGREQEILDTMANIPEAERKARLYGDWYVGEKSVYPYDREFNTRDPKGYDPMVWPHIEAIDPAASGTIGLIVAAWSPIDSIWYIVRDEYIEGDAPSKLVDEVYAITKNYNIVRRICDPHETWYRKQALVPTPQRGALVYLGVFKKNERKKELIAGLQEALSSGKMKLASWCKNLPGELTNCQWSEAGDDKIINASKYHLADATQYFWDSRPANYAVAQPQMTHDQEIRMKNKERKKNEALAKTMKLSRGRRWQR